MDSEQQNSEDWWDDLSLIQQQHIIEGMSDAENGRIVSSEEFWEILENIFVFLNGVKNLLLYIKGHIEEDILLSSI